MSKLEQRLYASQDDDGLLDLVVGIWCLLFGGTMVFHLGSTIPIIAIIPIIMWQPAKMHLAKTRHAPVEFSEKRKAQIKFTKGLAVAFFTVTMFLGLGVFYLFEQVIIEGKEILPKEQMMYLPGMILIGIGAVFFAGVGFFRHLTRFYVYAALTALSGVVAVYLTQEPGYAIASIGGLMTLLGSYMLIKFLKTHPRLDNGELQ